MFEKMKKVSFHILVWALMVIYLLVAPRVYAEKFILVGRPTTDITLDISNQTDQVWSSVDNLTKNISGGRNLYDLSGWSFFLGETDQMQFERYISLKSGDRTYYYPVKTIQRKDVEEFFKDIDIDLTQTGFSAYISREFIRPGSYSVVLVFRNLESNAVYRVPTNARIIRTLNDLHLVKDSDG